MPAEKPVDWDDPVQRFRVDKVFGINDKGFADITDLRTGESNRYKVKDPIGRYTITIIHVPTRTLTIQDVGTAKTRHVLRNN